MADGIRFATTETQFVVLGIRCATIRIGFVSRRFRRMLLQASLDAYNEARAAAVAAEAGARALTAYDTLAGRSP
jgi:hypothetical protein